MTGEGRVALTPKACRSLINDGHGVYLQQDAGVNSGYSDQDYQEWGVEIVATAKQLYQSAKLIIKVKQPLEQDIDYLTEGHILFSYLHLAADLALIDTLCDIGLTAIPFESITDNSGALPLLAPMSQVAGRIAAIRGASLLFTNRGGRGVLLGGVDGADTGHTVVLGAGVAGSHATAVLAALGAEVHVLDLDQNKLESLKQLHPEINIHMSSAATVAALCVQADLIIGAVLLAGRRAPVVLKQSVVKQMNPGSVIVDIAIDQGGCVEGIHSTSSEQLCYVDNGVIHSAVPNMPAAVARTSSQSLSSAILPYVLSLAVSDIEPQAEGEDVQSQAINSAIAIHHGEVVDETLRQELDLRESAQKQ